MRIIDGSFKQLKITEILGISPETLNKELHQFYEARRKELEEKIEKGKK
ncbi:hypothetical protein ES705_24188 [subsurface metagenome]|nr:hypothetical protein [Clostridia bacterium]